MVDNPANLHRKSVKLIPMGEDVGISFRYSASQAATLHVFFDATDVSVPTQFRYGVITGITAVVFIFTF
jgi:hypothetical protein